MIFSELWNNPTLSINPFFLLNILYLYFLFPHDDMLTINLWIYRRVLWFINYLYCTSCISFIKNNFWPQMALLTHILYSFVSRLEVDPTRRATMTCWNGSAMFISSTSSSPALPSSNTVFRVSLAPQSQFWRILPHVGIANFPSANGFLQNQCLFEWRGRLRNLTPHPHPGIPPWPSDPPNNGEAFGQTAFKQKAAVAGQKGCVAPFTEGCFCCGQR